MGRANHVSARRCHCQIRCQFPWIRPFAVSGQAKISNRCFIFEYLAKENLSKLTLFTPVRHFDTLTYDVVMYILYLGHRPSIHNFTLIFLHKYSTTHLLCHLNDNINCAEVYKRIPRLNYRVHIHQRSFSSPSSLPIWPGSGTSFGAKKMQESCSHNRFTAIYSQFQTEWDEINHLLCKITRILSSVSISIFYKHCKSKYFTFFHKNIMPRTTSGLPKTMLSKTEEFH